MSVRSGDRTQGKLQVLDAAMKLCVHTMTLCRNTNYFPKSQRWMLTAKIVDEATAALACIRSANSTLVSGVDFEIRHRYRASQQTEAHGHIAALYALVDLAYNMNSGLGSDQVAYWTKLIRDTDELLKGWIRSDEQTYKQMKQ